VEKYGTVRHVTIYENTEKTEFTSQITKARISARPHTHTHTHTQTQCI